ncbi:transglycosylase domain-containing protein [Macrococcus equipercicus]|uniref:Transglycosylase domain-containing protein n=1 Tax=Macrococcus equipercicus TaxID=69967 RepID=A0A9Q9BS07_9STAP|nr:transglycosylase domain-containing protein [Macrococcus equipercicus]UTH12846.1 transglycosylase domain-containing protein [Macrococcus equipercicus]
MATTKKKRNNKKLILQIIGGAVIAAALVLVLGLMLFIYYAWKAPSFNESSLRDQLPTKIYDKNNQLATVLYMGQKRESVKFDEIPDQMRDAVLATEDNRFYEHGALDFRRLAGAVMKNVTGGFGSQGASTLTQQVVKRSFLTEKKSIERKAQEAYLSYRLEQEYSKNDIFTMYMNKIYYSDGIYGIKTAAKYYFNKNLSDLTLAESAYLAGLPQIPNGYNIYDHPEAAEKRKDTVLYLMNRHNRITKAEMEKAQNEDLTTNLVHRTTADRKNIDQNDQRYASYVNVIKDEIKKNNAFKGKSINDILTSGLSIYTNMDMNAQQVLQNNVNNMIAYKNDDQQAGVTILDTKTGGLAAISGGRNYMDVVNRNQATDPHAVGSTIKPILSYGPVIENEKWSTDHKLQDQREYDINGNIFRNYDTQNHGIVTMRDALRKSYNIPALKTFQVVKNNAGNNASYNFAKNLGLNYSTKDLGPAEALGGGASEFSPEQMAAAFSAFGNGGQYNEPTAIRKIVTQDDETIKFTHRSEKVMEDYTAYMVTDMLKDVFEPYGSAYGTGIPGLNMAAKTGTSTYADETYRDYNLPDDAAKDVWITGYTPQYTMSVWMGFTKIAPDGVNSFVGHDEQVMPQILFRNVMSTISSYDGADFDKPASVTEVGNELQVTGTNPDNSVTTDPNHSSTEYQVSTTEAARSSNERAASVATEGPVTEQASTEAESAESVTIEAPTTEKTTTEQVTTEAPATEKTTTEQVTTEAPATEKTTTEQVTTEAPATEKTTTEQVTTEAPTTEQVTTEQVTTEAPTTEQVTTEQVTTEAPTTEKTTTEQVTTEAPTTEAVITKAVTTEAASN